MLAQRLALVEQPEATASDGPKLRIAVATQDLKTMNAHFGSARRFAVYDVTATDHRFIEALSFGGATDESGSHEKDGDDKIGPKVEALAGCNLLFVLAIGGPAAARIVSAHIHPVKLPKPETIESIIERIQTMMTGNPPPWLRKVMGAQAPRKMDFLDED